MNRVWHFFNPRPIRGEGSVMTRPTPLITRVARMQVGDGWVSAIARQWLYGESSRCRLCPLCTVRPGECLLLVAERVDDGDAPLYQITDGSR